MEKPKPDQEIKVDQGAVNSELEKAQKQLNLPKEEKHMDDSSQKTSKLAKLNFLITLLGLGALGYLHFTDKASTLAAISSSKATLKKEITADVQEGIAAAEQLESEGENDKVAALENKVNEYAAQINVLEMKVSQFQIDLEKNEDLRAKVGELQALVKKGKSAPKTASAKPTKKTSSKTSKKGKK